MKRLAPLALMLVVYMLLAWLWPLSPSWLSPELAWQAPSWPHPLGCGEGGVDLLALVVAASLRATALATVVAVIGFAVGVPLGAFAAQRGGVFERVIRRTADLLQAFPTFLFAMVILASVRQPTRVHLACVFALTSWPSFARVALAEASILRGAGFVQASRALGETELGVLYKHILPNLVPLARVQLGSTAAAVVLSETALSFVGFGPPDGVSLGSLLDQGVVAMLRAPHVLVVGGAAVLLLNSVLLFSAKGKRAT